MVNLDPAHSLPTMYDLPSEDPDEPGLPDTFHEIQPDLLRQTCRSPLWPAERVFIAADHNIYYDPDHLTWHKRPDWFVVVGVDRLYAGTDLRLSYVIWDEQVSPLVVVELLSPGTEREDLGRTLRKANAPPTKWEVYEQILKVPYYLVYNRYRDRLRAFRLVQGRYQEIELDESGLWIPELGLRLKLWHGTYDGITRQWLRWATEEGEWIPTLEERAEQERQRAEQERHRAEQEQQRAEQERHRAEQEQQRAEQEQQRAALEQQRADQAQQRAEQERQRAERLAEILQRLNIDPDALPE